MDEHDGSRPADLREGELDALCEKLVASGQFYMPPDNYGFSRKFAWVGDRFGVTWQLNWA